MENLGSNGQAMSAANENTSFNGADFNPDLLLKQNDLFKLVIENLPDQIYLKDRQSRFVLCNTPVAIDTGFKSPHEVIGKTDFDIHPDEAQQFFDDEQSLMNTATSLINHEEHYVDPNTGEMRWNLSTKVPIKDTSGEVIGLLGINRNITRMKKAEKEREEIMKNLVQRNKELEQFTQLLSEKTEELNKQAADLKLLNEEITRQKEQELEKAIAQGKFEIASEVLHDIGNALVGFGSHLNRINRSMEKINVDSVKNLGAFIKGQQAAIGNAIGADKANALVVITEGMTKTYNESKNEITTSTSELVNIITHIQEILNIQRQFVSGREGSQNRKPVSLVNIIDDCKAMLLASLEKRGILFSIDIRPGKHVIKGDHTKLMQVILNVLKNSMEAIDMFAARNSISVTLETVNDFIRLTIADTGSGFDAETSKNFFTRGFTTKASGTGLGLYNCKSIIESHSGTFEISSPRPWPWCSYYYKVSGIDLVSRG